MNTLDVVYAIASLALMLLLLLVCGLNSYGHCRSEVSRPAKAWMVFVEVVQLALSCVLVAVSSLLAPTFCRSQGLSPTVEALCFAFVFLATAFGLWRVYDNVERRFLRETQQAWKDHHVRPPTAA